MAFPTTGMDGHVRLKDRVQAALDRAMEAPNIDFKQSADWESLRCRIVKTALGMGNLRDGGLIIVGVAERNQVWEFDGIVQADLDTFDSDNLASFLNLYISPGPHVEAVVHYREGKTFLVLDIAEFEELPFVCKKNGPDDDNQGLVRGGVYFRPATGVPRTERIQDSEGMRDMLQLAADKAVRRFLERAEGVGLIQLAALPDAVAIEQAEFDAELGGL